MSEIKDNIFTKLLTQSLATIQTLESSISDAQVDSGTVDPEMINIKLHEFNTNLSKIIEAGNEMNEIALQEVPMELLNYLDVLNIEAKNPNHYELQIFKDAEKQASNLSDRIGYLKELHNAMKSIPPIRK